MSFYKIEKNGLVIGAGCVFLRWNGNKSRFFICDVDDAERVQDFLTERLYHADWLKESPQAAGAAEEAVVEIISASEYDEIIALLIDGEEIPVPEPEPEPEPPPEPEPEPEERPMTVQEMREKITELTSMAAKENYAKGAFFVMHDKVYQATRAIEKGSEVKPGYNCAQKTLEDLN